MMNFNTDCEHCRLKPKCKINVMLTKLASTVPYNKLEHTVKVNCSICRPYDYNSVQGTYTSVYVQGLTPINVDSCKHGCGFYNFCSSPIDFSIFDAFVKCATETHNLPLTFQSMCTCKLEEELDVK